MGWPVLLLGLLLVLPVYGIYNPDNEQPDNYERYIDSLLQEYERSQALRHQKLKNEKDKAFMSYSQNADKRKEEVNYQAKDTKFLEDTNLAVADDVREEDVEKSTEKPPTTDPTVDTNPAGVGEKKSDDSAPPLAPQFQKAPGSSNTRAYGETDFVFILIVAGCSVAGLAGLILAGVCWYNISSSARLHSNVKAARDVEYPAYGVTGPTKDRLPSPGDRKLAQSAQMYHYQHQKQQMIALEKANNDMKPEASDEESEEENEEGDYTVYECPGLAPTGEMEVRNPLFNEDVQTPVNGQPPVVNGHSENQGNQ